jgi:hypothetical protein
MYIDMCYNLCVLSYYYKQQRSLQTIVYFKRIPDKVSKKYCILKTRVTSEYNVYQARLISYLCQMCYHYFIDQCVLLSHVLKCLLNGKTMKPVW